MGVINCEIAWMEPGCMLMRCTLKGSMSGSLLDPHITSFFLFFTLFFTLNTVNNPLTLCIVAYPERVDCLMLINTQTTKAGWMEWGYQKRNVSHLRYWVELDQLLVPRLDLLCFESRDQALIYIVCRTTDFFISLRYPMVVIPFHWKIKHVSSNLKCPHWISKSKF